MVSRFVRRVRTASGAVAVQVVTKQGGEVPDVDHVGSAHSDTELAVLLEVAASRLRPGQDMLDLGQLESRPSRMQDVADFTIGVPADAPVQSDDSTRVAVGAARVVSTSSLLLWQVLLKTYSIVGLDVLGDEAFRGMALARIVEPTSKADSLRVLADVGAPCPTTRTLYRALRRCQTRDYRAKIAAVLAQFSSRAGRLGAMIMYDVTTLHFEVTDEDDLRKVGMSKEHRVDPQVQVGLLVDPSGFPLEAHLFEGNTAETKTIIPVLEAFQNRHGIADLVVVADAGMLSAGNLNAIEDAGFSFIVGSKITKAPYDLAEHFEAHGDYFSDGQILESSRTMGQGKAARERRIVYQWRFARSKRDNRNINAMVAKAENIAAGKAPFSRVRFLKITGETTELNQETVNRARRLAGLKGYVTNLGKKQMDGAAVITAYHDLWKVEASFRMTKSDLRARPIFHHTRDAIEAHLTVVLAALAVARHLQRRAAMVWSASAQWRSPLESRPGASRGSGADGSSSDLGSCTLARLGRTMMSVDADQQARLPAERVALQLAETLERLIALVNHELNAEANEGVQVDDPQWALAIRRVVEFSASCVEVLDEPAVLEALTAAERSRCDRASSFADCEL